MLTVCGHVVSTNYAASSSGQPTFFDFGNKYPDPNRFTVVIWGEDRWKFENLYPNPETYFLGKNVCARGVIRNYEGVPEIEAGAIFNFGIQQ